MFDELVFEQDFESFKKDAITIFFKENNLIIDEASLKIHTNHYQGSYESAFKDLFNDSELEGSDDTLKVRFREERNDIFYYGCLMKVVRSVDNLSVLLQMHYCTTSIDTEKLLDGISEDCLVQIDKITSKHKNKMVNLNNDGNIERYRKKSYWDYQKFTDFEPSKGQENTNTEGPTRTGVCAGDFPPRFDKLPKERPYKREHKQE
jgi:hypothetical protein